MPEPAEKVVNSVKVELVSIWARIFSGSLICFLFFSGLFFWVSGLSVYRFVESGFKLDEIIISIFLLPALFIISAICWFMYASETQLRIYPKYAAFEDKIKSRIFKTLGPIFRPLFKQSEKLSTFLKPYFIKLSTFLKPYFIKFSAVFEKLIDFTAKTIGWIVLASLAVGAICLIFNGVASLGTPALLTIIIIILIFK